MASIVPYITARKVDHNAKSRGRTMFAPTCSEGKSTAFGAKLLEKSGENRMILTPEIVFRKIECIHPDYLKAHGITALVLDVDNTLTADNSQVLEPSVQAWLDEMRAAGIRLTIVSNNTAKRVRPFAERIGLDWVPLACKPLTIGLMVARHRLGVKKSQMAMVGDQIFADRMAAGLYGCPCLYLLPRTPRDRNKFVQFKRKYEPYWLDRYYKKGGTVHE